MEGGRGGMEGGRGGMEYSLLTSYFIFWAVHAICACLGIFVSIPLSSVCRCGMLWDYRQLRGVQITI